jgi:D-arabinose 1-dehydrogenase-like Zn-dependent alcohol dehydrogenase
VGLGAFAISAPRRARAFAAKSKVKADIEVRPLSSINEIFDRLEHGGPQ